MTDVLIAGGGIAGSSLAIMLGRAGFSVELFERDRFPREKPCGEGVMPAGLGVLDRLGLLDAVGGAPFYGVRYFAGSTVAEARFPASPGIPASGRGQRRWRLDQVLFDAATATPRVSAHAGTAVQAPIVEGGAVRGLTVEGHGYRAPLVVCADGLRSPLRRRLWLEGRPGSRVRVGVRTHFRLAPGGEPPPWVEVFLGHGYEFYVTPLPEGQLLVSALAERAAVRGGAAASFARWLAEQPLLTAELRGAEQLTAYMGRAPLQSTARRGFAPGAVLLGDAAGFLDPITGGGISEALLSAQLLAGYAPRMLSGDQAPFVEFERARTVLLRDHTLLTRLVLGLSRYHWLACSTVRLMCACPALFSHLVGVAGGTRRLLPLGAPASRRPIAGDRGNAEVLWR